MLYRLAVDIAWLTVLVYSVRCFVYLIREVWNFANQLDRVFQIEDNSNKDDMP